MTEEVTITIDEAIKRIEEVVEECQKVVDTGIVFDDATIDMLYGDDVKFKEECLANYRRSANENRQLVKWLKDYEQLLEKEPVLDKIRAEIEEYKSTIDNAISEDELKIEGMKKAYTDCIDIIDKYKAESEVKE